MYENFKKDEECQVVSFFLARGHSLDSLLDMDYDKYLIYKFSMYSELERQVQMLGGGING